VTDFATPPRPAPPPPRPQPLRIRGRAPATRFLATLIIAAFALQLARGATSDLQRLVDVGAIWHPYIFQRGEYWRLLTAMFLHGGVLHLVMNLLALVQIGALYERMFGTPRYVFIYFTSGLLASLTSAFFTRSVSVGASGAIFGILGAFVLSVWRSPRFRKEPQARSIVNQLIFWILFNIVVGTQIPQIDMSAHLGGLVVGLLLGAILPHRTPPPPPPADQVIDVRPSGE
jgi:rhomboid protease GluP